MTGAASDWKPNLFVPGFPKCGTTALCDYLKQNPEVYVMSPKEPNTLVEGERMPRWGPRQVRLMRPYYPILDFKAYKRQFERHRDVRYRAEGSQNYIFPPRFPAKLKSFSPDAKLLFMIREQKSRLVSMYYFLYTEHGEPDFIRWASERLEPEVDKFLFRRKLASFHALFGDAMRVIRNEALERSPQPTMDEVFEFLGVAKVKVDRVSSKVGELKSLSPTQRAARSKRARFVRDVRLPATYLWNVADPGRSSPALNRLFQLHPLRRMMRGESEQRSNPVARRVDGLPEEGKIPPGLAEKLDEDYAETVGFCRDRHLLLADGGRD
ncbi:MAG: sulfotransferase [Nitrososphaerota archaeon]|nr:sulfotransferase [Nitrososphaerota archaeon]MDG6941886.1 sulfotransferase [Nitrososphaerota archaeon]MDG6946941.1 sulfotransferase [Nitrososphaerota archaeon]MDG6950648.1 sulfotransferase [Nitrososphaerota archaeon]